MNLCMKMWRPYKTYAIMMFLVYICVVVVFHFQLHRNLGLKYAAFQEKSDKKLDKALQKIEVLNRRIQDLSRIPAYKSPIPALGSMTTATTKLKPPIPVIPTTQTTGNLRNLYWQTNYDYSRPRMEYCHDHVTHAYTQIGKMFIYSAYFDGRNSSSHVIRMMTILPSRYRLPARCEFQYDDEVLSTEVSYYEMCENHARQYGGFILTCNVPPELKRIPCSIKVVSNVTLHPHHGHPHPLGNVSQASVPVLVSNGLATTSKKRFALCIPPVFGLIKQRLLVEFIELNLMLGVQHFNFYTFQINTDIQKILDYYEKAGVVTQIRWTIPVAANKIWYHGQLLTINDCLYRNMHHFDYVGFHDIDELMVPHGDFQNWSELITSLEKEYTNHTMAGYVFPSAFFDIANRNKPGKVPDTYFTDEIQRKTIFSQVRTKCLVKPAEIFELGIHHISRTFNPNSDVQRLRVEQGYLHHYRKCVTEFDPKMKCGSQTRDDRLASSGKELKSRSRKAMSDIFKHMAELIS